MFEPSDVARFRRELSAMIQRASNQDPEGFAQVVELLDLARAQLPEAAQEVRRAGYSWSELARPLGVTKSAAAQRFAWPLAVAYAPAAASDTPILDAMNDEIVDASLERYGMHR